MLAQVGDSVQEEAYKKPLEVIGERFAAWYGNAW